VQVADPARRHAVFSVGDMVLLSSRNIAMKTPGSNKLLPKYVGPFKVTEVLSSVTYRLALPSSMKCHDVFHVNLLLEYKSDGRSQPPPAALEFDDGEGGQWYAVDRVLSHRMVKLGRRTVTQYLVKWAGYGDEYNEWRDDQGVSAAATDEYWTRVGGRSAPPPHLRSRRGAQGWCQPPQAMHCGFRLMCCCLVVVCCLFCMPRAASSQVGESVACNILLLLASTF